MTEIGDNKPIRNWTGPVWGLAGLLVGSLLTWAAPKALRKMQGDTDAAKATTKVVKPAPTLALGNTLELTAQPPRGMLLTATSAIKLLGPSETKRTIQQANGIFTGFKNWTATAAYLKTAQGGLFLADPNKKPVSTGWSDADFDKFVRGMPLHVSLDPGKPYTLYFQRKGQRPINLGTFSLGAAKPVAAKPVAAKPVGVQPAGAKPAAPVSGKLP